MMLPGVYVVGRPIAASGNVATHQFIVLVPGTELSGLPVQKKADFSYCLLGAYNDEGFLRASEFAPSDNNYFQALKPTEKGRIQSASFVVCWISYDVPILRIYTAYRNYQNFKQTASEIKYPHSISAQLDEKEYNSNSWAQSCIKWGSGSARGENNLPGLDIGNDRVIPERYFLPFLTEKAQHKKQTLIA